MSDLLREKNWRILQTADDVDETILRAVEDLVDSWPEGESMGAEEFIDELCRFYGGSGHNEDDWDLESYDNAAARKIMREARKLRRERG